MVTIHTAFVLPEPIGTFDLVMFGHVGTPVLASTEGASTWAPLADSPTWNARGAKSKTMEHRALFCRFGLKTASGVIPTEQ